MKVGEDEEYWNPAHRYLEPVDQTEVTAVFDADCSQKAEEPQCFSWSLFSECEAAAEPKYQSTENKLKIKNQSA